MITRTPIRFALALLIALTLVLSTTGCWARLLGSRESTRLTPRATRTSAQAQAGSATLWPTVTPSSTPLSSAPTTEATVPPMATAQAPVLQPTTPASPSPSIPTLAPPQVTPGIPSTPNTPFDVTFSEAQLNDYIAGQIISQGGVEITEPSITLADGEALVHALAYHEGSTLSMGLTLRGTPEIYQGALFVRVQQVTFDDNIRGITRLLAKALVDAAISSYSGEHGIAVPVDTVEFETVTITPDNVRIVGRTR